MEMLPKNFKTWRAEFQEDHVTVQKIHWEEIAASLENGQIFGCRQKIFAIWNWEVIGKKNGYVCARGDMHVVQIVLSSPDWATEQNLGQFPGLGIFFQENSLVGEYRHTYFRQVNFEMHMRQMG